MWTGIGKDTEVMASSSSPPQGSSFPSLFLLLSLSSLCFLQLLAFPLLLLVIYALPTLFINHSSNQYFVLVITLLLTFSYLLIPYSTIYTKVIAVNILIEMILVSLLTDLS